MSKKSKKEETPIMMLVWGDSPGVATGFGNVTRNIFTKIAKRNPRFHFDFIGINDSGGWKDPERFGQNMHIYPAIGAGSIDVFGRPRLINGLLKKDRDLEPPWDLIFTLNDPFVLEEGVPQWGSGAMGTLKGISNSFREQFPPSWWNKIISYWPVDSEIKTNWYSNAIGLADVAVAYTNYGKDEILSAERRHGKKILKNPLRVIYHGVDTNIFKPLSDEEKIAFRQEFFQGKIADDTFVCILVARNQPRKDIPRAMKAFKEFNNKRPDSFLYVHAKNTDAGGTLSEIARNIGLKETENWGFPSKFDENRGYPEDVLNMLYNVADCHISTTLGEGFGLPFFEAMATKTLNVGPDNTTVPELFNITKGDGIEKLKDDDYLKKIRGIPVKSGSNQSEFFCLGGTDKERFRPLTNVEDMVEKLIWVYDNPGKAKMIADNAYNWVQQYDWDKISKEWEQLFIDTFDQLQKERDSWIPPKDWVEGTMPPSVKYVPADKELDESK